MTAMIDVEKANAWALSALARLATVSAWPDADLKFRQKVVQRHHRERRRFCTLIEKGDTRAIRRQDRMLNSYAGRLCAFLEEVVPSAGVALPSPISTEALEQQLKACRPMKRLHECAQLHVHTKANGTKRRVISPGTRARVSQRLVGHVLGAWELGYPYEFNQRGRGRNVAVRKLVQLMEEMGLRHLVLFDIENFFASVKPSHLSWLPLPRQAMQHSVFFNRDAILLHGKLHGAEAEAARHGLPQGARLSGNIASLLLGRELCSLSGAGDIVTYVDDGVIGACDPAGAEHLAKALKTRFSNHPGGPLSFKHLTVIDVAKGFSFLGYWVRLIVVDGQQHTVIRPSHEAKTRLKRGVFKRLREIGPEIDFDKAMIRASAYRDNWRNSYPLWQPSELELLEFEVEVEMYVDDYLNGYTKKIIVPSLPVLSGG